MSSTGICSTATNNEYPPVLKRMFVDIIINANAEQALPQQKATIAE
jgi:hypothetical protein